MRHDVSLEPLRAGRSEFAGLFLILYDDEFGSSHRQFRETGDFDRGRGTCFFERAAIVVLHRLDPARIMAEDEGVVFPERSVLDEDGGDGAEPLVHFRFEDRSSGAHVGVGAKFEDFGLEGDHFEKFRHSLAR